MKEQNIRNFAIGAICLMVAFQSAAAQPYRWTGEGADADWSTPENWEGNAVPPTLSTLHFGRGRPWTLRAWRGNPEEGERPERRRGRASVFSFQHAALEGDGQWSRPVTE